ncbi:MAG: integrase core domain-containing protein [Chloroflexota bacterium]
MGDYSLKDVTAPKIERVADNIFGTGMNIVQYFFLTLQAWIFVHIRQWVKPTGSVASGLIFDAILSRSQLMLENAMLRKQLIILRRQVERPKLSDEDRRWLVILASQFKNWRHALLIVQPETLLRWHHELFRAFWRHKTKTDKREPRIPQETIDLIQTMAKDNILWGAERIRGELLHFGIKVSKRTILKYMRSVREPRPSGQNWLTFMQNHGRDIWACDFLQTYDVFFRMIFIFVIIELGSRRVVYIGITRHPNDIWVSRQLSAACDWDNQPKYLVLDNDSKFGENFEQVAKHREVELLKTPFKAPKANATCERFLGSLQRECLDHLIILNELQLRRVTREYIGYYNDHRPHQGIEQCRPNGTAPPDLSEAVVGIDVKPVLGGLHHIYERKRAS